MGENLIACRHIECGEDHVVRVVAEGQLGKVPRSGLWVNANHNDADPVHWNAYYEYTCVEGETFPPAIHGSYWVLVRATRHDTE